MHPPHNTESDVDPQEPPSTPPLAPKRRDRVASLVNRFLQFQWNAFKGEAFSSKPMDDFSE